MIRQQLPQAIAELHLQAVANEARMTTATAAREEKRRELRGYRGLPSKREKQYQSEKEVVIDLVSNQCPACGAAFADYEACCSLQCSACRGWFCGLCLGHGDGSWSRSACHRHVEVCTDRPADMDQRHFYTLDLWKRHVAARQHRLCAQYLEKTDLSSTLKARLLLCDFPMP